MNLESTAANVNGGSWQSRLGGDSPNSGRQLGTKGGLASLLNRFVLHRTCDVGACVSRTKITACLCGSICARQLLGHPLGQGRGVVPRYRRKVSMVTSMAVRNRYRAMSTKTCRLYDRAVPCSHTASRTAAMRRNVRSNVRQDSQHPLTIRAISGLRSAAMR